MSFELHSDLVRDGIDMGTFPMCRVLLIDDFTYPWFVLVPQMSDLQDTIDMSPTDHAMLWQESLTFSKAIMTLFAGDKLNVAALGNMTPQLHIHHIVRYKTDPAWPGPMWGVKPMQSYTEDARNSIRRKLARFGIEGFKSA